MNDPMNASSHHPKIRVALTVPNSICVAGAFVSGRLETECRADRGLGIGVMMVELLAVQELSSRDHAATSTFLHSRRCFQGPGLPPSNAVKAYPLVGDPPLPADFFQARRGLSTFDFQFRLPRSSPASISFGGGLARVKYELRATIEVFWKGEMRLITDKREVDVVDIFEENFNTVEPEGVVVGENGKVWVQGRIVGGFIVSGESACVELFVKNHSAKRNSGLSITLSRRLHLPGQPTAQRTPLQISDTLTTVAFRGPEYVVNPGVQGVANLVFDVPKHARGVKGGLRDDDESEVHQTEPLFEVKSFVDIKLLMGIGSKDIQLLLPVIIIHPLAVAMLPPDSRYLSAPPVVPELARQWDKLSDPPSGPSPSPLGHPAQPINYPLQPYHDRGQIWFSSPSGLPDYPDLYYTPQPQPGQYYLPQHSPPLGRVMRSSSAGPLNPSAYPLLSPTAAVFHPHPLSMEPEKGKGQRALRISHHLRQTSRHRSASPPSHRFPRLGPRPLPAPPHDVELAAMGRTPQVIAAVSALADPQQSIVHSPRPVQSHKNSSADLPIHASLAKCEQVEDLERMAAEVGETNPDVSRKLSTTASDSLCGASTELRECQSDDRLSPEMVGDGTSSEGPNPPKDAIQDMRLTENQGHAVAASHLPLTHSPVHPTPPTPLNAVTPVKVSRRASENGLEALERRLIADVGTRKGPMPLPISIPPPNAAREPLLDSAISSLTLADGGSPDEDGRTHKAGQATRSESGGSAIWDTTFEGKGRPRFVVGDPVAGSSKDPPGRRDGKSVTRTNGKVVCRNRRSVHGRVAAWLGAIVPDHPPDDAPQPITPSPSISPSSVSATLPQSYDNASCSVDNENMQTGVCAVPNPRSSGFVPVGAFKRETLPPRAPRTPQAAALLIHAVQESSCKSPQPPMADRVTTPRSAGQSEKANIPHRFKKHLVSPNSLIAPREPEVKYDVRSARGGRGGQVTAVAALWASGALQMDRKLEKKETAAELRLSPVPSPARATAAGVSLSPNTAGELKPRGRIVNHLRGPAESVGVHEAQRQSPEAKACRSKTKTKPLFTKTPFVPAVVSSSYATPMLSSSASLARPPLPSGERPPPPSKAMPGIAESEPVTGKSPVSSIDISKAKATAPLKTAGDLAFGQARLRDLIKKYQA